MAEIVFRPVCSACGEVLYCDVSITDSWLELTANYKEPWKTKSVSIEPICCPYCGKTFEKIVMPTRLPYHTNIIDGHIEEGEK